MIAKIIEQSPKGSEKDWYKAFWNQIADEPDSLQIAARYYFANAVSAYLRARRTESAAIKAAKIKEKTEIAKAKFKRRLQREISIVLLTMDTPNGKMLGECTKADCLKLGGWYVELARKIPPRKTVADTLTEDQLQIIWRETKK